MRKRFFATKKDPSKKTTITIKEHGLIGRGSEKEVHDVKVIIRKNKNKKTRNFALKRFDKISEIEYPFSNPAVQVRNYNALKELNMKKKLGLNLIRTFRLIEAPGKTPGILSTRLKILDWNFFKKLPSETKKDVLSKIVRQQKIVQEEGFSIGRDAFVLTVQNNTVVPIIADFKFIHPSQKK